jgi:P pilus assembly protein, pilin FimA
MNKTLLSAALIAGFGFAAFAPQTARAATQNPTPDGTITITGQVVAQTCKVDGNSYGTSDNVAVTLPSVLTTQLASSGQVAQKTPFAINVTGCDPALSNVQTFFSGTNIDTTTGNLSNTGSASNVQVQLLNSTSAAMTLNGASAIAQNSPVVTLSSGAATLNYYAQYYATGATGAGAVNTSVAFTLIYQ